MEQRGQSPQRTGKGAGSGGGGEGGRDNPPVEPEPSLYPDFAPTDSAEEPH